MEISFTTPNQRKEIQKFIQTELMKRGFHAQITTLDETEFRDGSIGFNLETEEFQTTPVLFKSIKLMSFNSFISDVKEADNGFEYRTFSISINARYNHFGGGSNGCNVLSVRGEFSEDEIWDLEAR